ncbi:DUF1624 domain-containing protein [Ectothiorhodospiraceae bacterium 2226]|nr:DUF1624 domain-containing protein [Ectothiorhodospiraceae bacterium 2226]
MKPPPATSTPLAARTRYPLVDAARGLAIVLMIGYHFVFDLHYFGVVQVDLYHAQPWLALRAFIVTLFLLLVGVSLHLAARGGLSARRYARRLALLVLYALLVSAGSYMLFPDSMIFFGVLHFIALASVLGLAFVGLYRTNLVLGAGLVAFGLLYAHPLFDRPWLQWVGLMTHKPVTEDYVPLLPWFGVVLIGLFLGRLVFERRPVGPLQAAPRSALARGLALGGRHSLHIYMLHQPILLGALYGVLWLLGRV